MNIIYEEGDLLDFFRNGECDTIAHVCNCQKVMGSGIALQIKNEFPEAFDAYEKFNHAPELELGTLSTAKTEFGMIANLHAQHLYGYDGSRFVNYEALYKTLSDARDIMLKKGYSKIGVPYLMACDRAGGDWRIVEVMLEVIFENSGIDVLVVVFKK